MRELPRNPRLREAFEITAPSRMQAVSLPLCAPVRYQGAPAFRSIQRRSVTKASLWTSRRLFQGLARWVWRGILDRHRVLTHAGRVGRDPNGLRAFLYAA